MHTDASAAPTQNNVGVQRGRPSVLVYGSAMLLSLMAISTAALWVRLANDVPPLVLVLGRGLISFLVMLPWLIRYPLTTATYTRGAAAGFCLFFHFFFWFASLRYTSVSISTTLICSTSLWLALVDGIKEIVRRFSVRARHSDRCALPSREALKHIAFVVLGIAGNAIVAFGNEDRNVEDTRSALLHFRGALLAIGGAWAGGAYIVVNKGDVQKEGTNMLSFACVTNAFSSVLALLGVLGTHEESSVPEASNASYVYVILLALLPQLIGHNLLLWALKVGGKPSQVSMVWLGEPIVASFLAFIFLDEGITWATVFGSCLVFPSLWMAAKMSEADEEGLDEKVEI